jgi:hypothetical protein
VLSERRSVVPSVYIRVMKCGANQAAFRGCCHDRIEGPEWLTNRDSFNLACGHSDDRCRNPAGECARPPASENPENRNHPSSSDSRPFGKYPEQSAAWAASVEKTSAFDELVFPPQSERPPPRPASADTT